MRKLAPHALLALLAACTGTRTGNPFGDNGKRTGGENGGGTLGNAGGSQCQAEPEALASLDVVTPLGISAAQVLAFAQGEHESSIRWQPLEVATFAPESGEHAVTVRVTPEDSKARFVKYSERPNTGGSGGPTIELAPQSCEGLDAVEIDVKVDIMSDGGAIDEHLAGTLRASSALWATLHLDLKAAELGGDFHVVSSKPAGFTLAQLAIDLGFSPLGLRGSVSGVLQMVAAGSSTSTASAAAAGGAFATIGSDASCDDAGLPIEAAHKLQAFSAQDAIDAVNAVQSMTGTWHDGSTGRFDVRFTRDDRSICAILEQQPAYAVDSTPAGTLRARGRLHVVSTDGRLDADWPIVLDARPDVNGLLQDVSMSLDRAELDMVGPATLQATYGIRGLDGSGYDAVQVSLALHVMPADPASSATGELTVTGLKLADCAKQPPPAPMQAPPGTAAGGSAGCPGADFIQIESIAWP
jgi:hypothetical protein